MKHPLQAVFLGLVLLALVQVGWQHARLPARVAIHFNATGRANAWAPRNAQTLLQVATIGFMAALIEGAAYAQARLPARVINLPHRDHWLAPEHAAATRSWLVGAGLAIGSALMVFFIGLFHLVYLANLQPPARLSSAVWWLLGGLLAVIAVTGVRLVARFGRPPAA